MERVRFHVNPHDRNDEDREEGIVRQVARLILGTDSGVKRQDRGYKWCLDSHNDWKMDRDLNTGEYILAWRYGGGGNLCRMLLAREWIIFRLGIDHFNEKNNFLHAMEECTRDEASFVDSQKPYEAR